MEFEGEFESDRPPEELWDYFTDPDIIADCAPGMKEMELNSPSEFEAVVTVGVGSVKPTFDVDGVVTEADQPRKLVMTAEGSGGRNAFETVGTMTMNETDEGGTNLQWKAETNVSGLIASLGQRALGSVADRLVGNFFDDMEEKIQENVEAESRMAAAEDSEASLD